MGAISADYITIENNKIYENAWYSRYGCSGSTIFTINKNPNDTNTGYRNFVRNNIIWNNRGLVKWIGTGKYNVVKDANGNVISYQVADGKYSDGNGFILDISAKDANGQNFKGRTLIANNLLVHNGGSGVHALQQFRVDIVNNTAYLNGDKVNYPDIYARDTVDARFRNNIVYARVGGKVNSNTNNTNVTYDYNIYFNGTIATGTQGTHDIVADPQINNPSLTPCVTIANSPDVNCTGADFKIAHPSPALDSGIVISGVTPTTDITNVARPLGNGIDRGAYEYNILPRVVFNATSPSSVSGTLNTQLNYQIVAYNYPDSYSATGLPPGLTLNTSNGLISGRPSSRGTFNATVSGTNEVGRGANATITFIIN